MPEADFCHTVACHTSIVESIEIQWTQITWKDSFKGIWRASWCKIANKLSFIWQQFNEDLEVNLISWGFGFKLPWLSLRWLIWNASIFYLFTAEIRHLADHFDNYFFHTIPRESHELYDKISYRNSPLDDVLTWHQLLLVITIACQVRLRRLFAYTVD